MPRSNPEAKEASTIKFRVYGLKEDLKESRYTTRKNGLLGQSMDMNKPKPKDRLCLDIIKLLKLKGEHQSKKRCVLEPEQPMHEEMRCEPETKTFATKVQVRSKKR